jgi:hypothetical protein
MSPSPEVAEELNTLKHLFLRFLLKSLDVRLVLLGRIDLILASRCRRSSFVDDSALNQ